MRILVLHSRYQSGPMSGENRVVDDECQLLMSGGHDVHTSQPVASADGLADAVRLGARAVYSREAAGTLERLVKETGADVVHCHNLFPMHSPGVIRTAARAGDRCVVTLHNFRFLCLPGTLLRDGEI